MKKLLTEVAARSLDLIISNSTIRNITLRKFERKIYEKFLGNADNCPYGVQKDKLAMVRSMIHSIDRALERGAISVPVRRGLLYSYIGNVLLRGENEQVRQFKEEYGTEPPGFLTISPTKRCNLHCKGCYAGSTSATATTLDFEIFDRIMKEKKELWGSYFTVISGGEPFMYKSRGKDLLDIAEKYPDNFFLVYTNGTLIDEKTAGRLAEVGNVTPAISVEGFEEETDWRRGKGVYEKILKAFKNLREAGVPYGISVTATRKNVDLLINGEIFDYYFNEQGVIYGWIFQYMPIGRSFTLDMMITPQQRLMLYEKAWSLVRNKKMLIADFWNSATASFGCIAAGRKSGYMYIEWNGNVTPCVFVPFSTNNICEIYEKGGNLNTALFSPFMKEIRDWQDNYCLKRQAGEVCNLMRPCPIRDHCAEMYKAVISHHAHPIDENAGDALEDVKYRQGLTYYGEEVERLTKNIWKEEYLAAR